MTVMERKKAFSENYSYFRKEIPEVAVNCYTGSIKCLLSNRGYVISEDLIFSLGQGYMLTMRHDEYGIPELNFDLLEIVDVFCRETRLNLIRNQIDKNNFIDQLDGLCKSMKGLVAWVNSAHLKYSDIYYSEKGYLHAVVIEQLLNNKTQAFISDHLIVTMPPKACQACLPMNDLYKGLTETVKSITVDIMGAYIGLEFKDDFQPDIPKEKVRERLLSNSLDILENHRTGSDIIKYGEHYHRELQRLKGNDLRQVLRKINDHVKTLYVIPNRKLLGDTLSEYVGFSKELNLLYTEMLRNWNILANLCLKASVTLNQRDFMNFMKRIEIIEKSELSFWRALTVKLRDGMLSGIKNSKI